MSFAARLIETAAEFELPTIRVWYCSVGLSSANAII
jgi:hypothetical protein